MSILLLLKSSINNVGGSLALNRVSFFRTLVISSQQQAPAERKVRASLPQKAEKILPVARPQDKSPGDTVCCGRHLVHRWGKAAFLACAPLP